VKSIVFVLLAVGICFVAITTQYRSSTEEIPPGLYPMEALAWDSKESLKGSYLNGANGLIAADSVFVIKFPASSTTTGVIPDGSAAVSRQVRWWFLDVNTQLASAACTLTVYSDDVAGGSVWFLGQTLNSGRQNNFPAFRNSIDSVKIATDDNALFGDTVWVLWGID
jgi:hypothetical protein